jgi:cytochrome c peroxidase
LGDTARHAPSLLGAGYGSWFYWDGRRDSLWAQALTPVESLEEMGATRVEVARYVLEHKAYGPIYEAIFGDRPDLSRRPTFPRRAGPFAEGDAKAAWAAMSPSSQHTVNEVFANVGKSIAAFERSLVPAESKFDRYVASLLEEGASEAARMLSADELSGLALFIDDQRTQCLRCHNGPLFTNHGFHNVGTGAFEGARLDFGRLVGMQAALVDPFNCDGRYSDAAREDCKDLRFLQRGTHAAEMNGAFKVPTLRNVAMTAPYMHDGRYRALEEVLQHYREPPDPSRVRHELARTELSDIEVKQLIAFLSTLTGE